MSILPTDSPTDCTTDCPNDSPADFSIDCAKDLATGFSKDCPTAFSATRAKACLSKVTKVYQKKRPEPDWETVERYLPLAKSMVSKMYKLFSGTVDIQDIYSIALLGLIQATQTFLAGKGMHFGSYAKLRIRGALLDELRKMDWMSRSERTRVKQYKKGIEALTLELKREPKPCEIQAALKLSPDGHRALEDLAKPFYILPLDKPLDGSKEGEIFNFHEIVSDLTEMDARDLTENKDLYSVLRQGLEQLDATPKKVLVLYYIEGLKLSEIAAVFKVSESRICQIHNKALGQLRDLVHTSN